MTALTPWQQRVYDHAASAIDAGRLGHGLLFCGPAKLGKLAVAELLAKRLLCLDREPGGEPCGGCRSCRLFTVRSQTDPPELRPDGSLAHPGGHTGHPDFSQISYGINEKAKPKPKSRSEIVIEQIRKLSERMALSPHYGEVKVAIIEPADALNHAGANALLKTLEEPVAGRYLWLVSAHPARLSATIRSRCQKIEFRLPSQSESLVWLQQQGHTQTSAAEALAAARGHPGLAHEWLQGGGLDLRRQVASDLEQVTSGQLAVVEAAQRWVADGDTDQRLSFAADLALAMARQSDGLTDPMGTRSLAAWFDRANRARGLLRTTVRADLVVVELLMAWRAGEARRAAGKRGGSDMQGTVA